MRPRQEEHDTLESPAPVVHGAQQDKAATAAEVAALPLGTVVADSYRIVTVVGDGGTALVYEAEDVRIGRRVALKILADPGATGLEHQRFLQDAALAAKVDHPNVVRIYQAGEWQGRPYIAMEYIDGTSLAEIPDLDWPTLVRVMTEIAEALGETHALGIVHRDLSPENILVDRKGKAKLLDFGIARGRWSALTGPSLRYTIGRFEYMSPEQAYDPRTVTAASDTFSLAAIMYEALTGRPPHCRDDDGEGPDARQLICDRLLSKAPPPDPRLSNRSIPDDLAAVVLTALSFDPARRFPSARAFAGALSPFVAQPIVLAGTEAALPPPASVSTHEEPAPVASPPRPGSLMPWRAIVVGVVAVGALATVLILLATKHVAAPRPPEPDVPTARTAADATTSSIASLEAAPPITESAKTSAKATIELVSKPEGASAIVDGQLLVLPQTISGTLGSRTIFVLEKAGYETRTITLEFATETAQEVVRLSRRPRPPRNAAKDTDERPLYLLPKDQLKTPEDPD